MSEKQSRDEYLRLIDVLNRLTRCSNQAFSGVTAVSWPDQFGAMAPFYQIKGRADAQMSFARQALEKFITVQQPAVLTIAAANLEASRLRAIEALSFAVEQKGNVNSIEDLRGKLAGMLDVSSSVAASQIYPLVMYLAVIDLLETFESYCARAFGGVTAVSWPEKDGAMAPFYEDKALATEQAGFAKLALVKFITEPDESVLEVATANLKASRVRALAALGFAVERKGNVNGIDDCRNQIEAMSVNGLWAPFAP